MGVSLNAFDRLVGEGVYAALATDRPSEEGLARARTREGKRRPAEGWQVSWPKHRRAADLAGRVFLASEVAPDAPRFVIDDRAIVDLTLAGEHPLRAMGYGIVSLNEVRRDVLRRIIAL